LIPLRSLREIFYKVSRKARKGRKEKNNALFLLKNFNSFALFAPFARDFYKVSRKARKGRKEK